MGFKTTIGGHTFREENGIWWDPNGNEMSNESIYRIFGNKKVKPDPKTGRLKFDWDYNNSRTSKQKEQERDHQFNFPEGGAYDAQGNNRVRDYNKRPVTGSEKIENEMGNMMDSMRRGRKEDLFNELDSIGGGKGFWQPTSDQNNPYLPKDRGAEWRALQEAIERSGEINRGPGFKRENYGFGGGEPWNSPHPFERRGPAMYDPSIKINPNDFLRKGPAMHDPNNQINPSDYITPYKSNGLNQLSPSGIANFNRKSWNDMKGY